MLVTFDPWCANFAYVFPNNCLIDFDQAFVKSDKYILSDKIGKNQEAEGLKFRKREYL